jgi:CBS domain-containing protein
MKARDIMAENPVYITPETSLREVADLMGRNDCGCLPVVEDGESRRLIGVVTDRDLAVRGIAQGRDIDGPVRDVMSENPSCCTPDADLHTVEEIMTTRLVRRVPVVDDEGACVGMIAQADLARANGAIGNREVGRLIERISSPTMSARSDLDAGVRPGPH